LLGTTEGEPGAATAEKSWRESDVDRIDPALLGSVMGGRGWGLGPNGGIKRRKNYAKVYK
jgi:hypothetical protein